MVDWKESNEHFKRLVMGYGPHSWEVTDYAETNFPLLIQSLEEQEKRIEFLEKSLNQSAMLGNVTLNPILMVDGELQAEEDVQYLRSDTCTPKEKLEGLIRWIDRAKASLPTPNNDNEYNINSAIFQTLDEVQKELREVMK